MANKKNRKKTLLAGLALFALAGVVGTTFATFIITGGKTSAEVTGPDVSVAGVSNDSVNIEAALNDSTLVYGAPSDSSEGLVHGDEKEVEDLVISLDITVTGKTDNWSNGIKIEASYASGDAEQLNKYMTLPESVTVTVGNGAEDFKETGSETNVYTVTKTLTFGWGSDFNNQNPVEYYKDSVETPDTIEEELRNALTAIDAASVKFTVSVA